MSQAFTIQDPVSTKGGEEVAFTFRTEHSARRCTISRSAIAMLDTRHTPNLVEAFDNVRLRVMDRLIDRANAERNLETIALSTSDF